MPRVPLVAWRGCMVSVDMVAPLEELAASVRPYVTPIPGFGSYRNNRASAAIDSGSGHVDVYMGNGWKPSDRAAFVANGRRMGLAVFDRPKRWWSPTRRRWLTETWAHHAHVLLKDSRDLSPAAREQLRRWYAGSNGLVGNDPDTGPRHYLRQTWAQYLASKPKPAAPTTTSPVKVPTTTAPPKKEDPMPLNASDLVAIRLAVRAELDSIETARTVWTRHPLVKDPRQAEDVRVTPSTLLEAAVNVPADEDDTTEPPAEQAS